MLPVITDQYDDRNGQRRHVLTKIYQVPSFVKNAVATPLDNVADVPVTVYADVVRRKFPCHTKIATLMSTMFFLDQVQAFSADEAGFIKTRLEKSAEYWGVGGEFRTLLNDFIKRASEDTTKYALEIQDGAATHRRFPITTAEDVVKSAELLLANRDKFPLSMRREASRNMLKAAEQLGADLSPATAEYIEKAAGYGAALPQDVANGIAGRALNIGSTNKELRIGLAKVAEAASQKRMAIPQLTKIAEMLDQVDRSTGLNHRYSAEFKTPEEICFDITAKQAQAVLDSRLQLTTGKLIKVSDLNRLPLDKIASIMGPDFAKEVTNTDGSVNTEKLAELAPTLPRDDATLLELAMESAGVTV